MKIKIEQRHLRVPAVLAGYFLLTVIMTYPLVVDFFTAVPGDGGDAPVFLNNHWWTKKALTELQTNPFHHEYKFYPEGVSLTFHTYTFLNTLLSLPLQFVIGTIGAFNSVYFLTFILSGFGMYCLLREFRAPVSAAFFAGCVYAFCPYRTAHSLGSFNLLTTQWFPFYFIYIRRSFDRLKIRNLFSMSIFLLLIGLSDLTYLMFALMLMGFYIAYQFVRLFISRPAFVEKADETGPDAKSTSLLHDLKRWLIFSCLCTACAAAVISPVWISALLELKEQGNYISSPLIDAERWSADVGAYLLPSIFHPMMGGLTHLFRNVFTGYPSEWTVFPGYITVGLSVIFFLFFSRRRSEGKTRDLYFFLLIAVIFFILSLGPTLQIFGKKYFAGRMPFSWLYSLPAVSGGRMPARYSLMVIFGLSIYAGLGYRCVIDFLCGSFACKRIMKAALTAALLYEFWPFPLEVQRLEVPDIYREIAQEEGDFTVLEVPIGIRSGTYADMTERSIYEYYQTVHEKRLLSGMAARLPFRHISYRRSVPFISDLYKAGKGEIDFPEVDQDYRAGAYRVLRFLSVKYIILHEATPVHGWTTTREILKQMRSWLSDVLAREPDRILNQSQGSIYIWKRKDWNRRSEKKRKTVDFGTREARMHLPVSCGPERNWDEHTLIVCHGDVIDTFIRFDEKRDRKATAVVSPYFFSDRIPVPFEIKICSEEAELKAVYLRDKWVNVEFDWPGEQQRTGMNRLTIRNMSRPETIGETESFSPVNITARSGIWKDEPRGDVYRAGVNVALPVEGFQAAVIDAENGAVLWQQSFQAEETDKFRDSLDDTRRGAIVIVLYKSGIAIRNGREWAEALRPAGGGKDGPSGKGMIFIGVMGADEDTAVQSYQEELSVVHIAGKNSKTAAPLLLDTISIENYEF